MKYLVSLVCLCLFALCADACDTVVRFRSVTGYSNGCQGTEVVPGVSNNTTGYSGSCGTVSSNAVFVQRNVSYTPTRTVFFVQRGQDYSANFNNGYSQSFNRSRSLSFQRSRSVGSRTVFFQQSVRTPRVQREVITERRGLFGLGVLPIRRVTRTIITD